MALVINITADTGTAASTVRQFQANITQAMAGIDAKMQDTARKTGQATDAWRTSLQQMATTVRPAIFGANELGASFLKTGQAAGATTAQLTKLSGAYGAAGKAATDAARATQQFGQQTVQLGSSLKNLAAGFGVVLSAQALVGFTRALVDAGLAQEKLMLTLRGATGSVLAAGEAYTFVRGVANQLGVDLQTSVDGFAKLTAATKDTAVQGQQTRDLFVAMAQASRVMGLSTAEVGGVMTALTQIIGKNTVSLEELKQQLGERLPSVLRLTAKEMGETTGKFIEMVSKGEVLATDFIPAVTRAFQTMGAEAPSAAASAAASLARVGNAWFELKAAIAQSGVLDAISAIAERTASAFRGIGQLIRGTQALQGTERITQLQTNLVTLTRQLQLAEVEGQRLMATGLRPEAAMAQTENLRTRIKAVADEITGIAGTLREASLEEEAIAQRLKAGGGQDATLKFLQERKNTAAEFKKELVEINRELAAVQSKDVGQLLAVGLDPLSQSFEREQKAQESRLLKARQDVQDKLLGIDRKGMARASKEAESEATRRAKVEQQAMEQSLKVQEALIAQSFDERRQLIDAQFSEDLAREPLRVKELSDVRSAQLQATAVEEARFVEQIRIDSLTRQHLTAEEFAAQREAIIKRTTEVELKASQQTLQQQIKDAELLVDVTERVNAQIIDRDEKMMEERTRVVERELDQQQREYEQFTDRVAGSLATIFEDLLTGTLDLLDTFKSLFLRTIAQIAADAATRTIIVPIATQVLGGLGAALPGVGAALGTTGAQGGEGLASLGGTGLQALGLTSLLSGHFKSFGEILAKGLAGVRGAINTVLFGTATPGLPGGMPLIPMLAGAVGLGGNIWSALNAETTAGRVGGSIGAAGAAASLAANMLPALLPAMLGPIGLIVAGLAPLLAPLIGGLFGAEGPRFGLGGLGGLAIGADGGRLTVGGQLTSQVGAAERLPGGVDPQAIQAALSDGVTRLVNGMVDAINLIAIDPTELLGPTQQALNDAMAGALRINSGNVQNFEQDMEDQLKFVGVQVSSFFLRPLSDAFRQLESAELDQQISRLPETTQGMVAVFKGMNTQLDELSTVANTDVLRQLSEVRNRVEDFGNALADTARVISTSIVDQISDQLIAQANVLLDAPLAQQITRFGAVMNQSFAALNSLRTTQRSLQEGGLNAGGVTGQLERLSTLMVDTAATVSMDIVTGALGELATNLDRVLIQPIRVQATTVNSLFTQSLQALDTLWQQWHRLEGEGLDASRVQAQFERLLGGALSSVQRLTQEAFETQSLTDFLNVLLSIPEALTNMNPMFQQVRQLGLALAQVAQPIQQVIDATMIDLQTPGERAADTAQQVRDLQDAITDAGSAIDQVLPLYTQMAQAIQANAQAQIDVVNAQADAQTEAINTAVDAWLDAITTWADASRDGVNQWADEMTTVINTAADAATDALNEWATTQMEAVRTWTETMTQAINDWAQSAQTTASQLASVNDTLLGEMSPAQQRATLEAQKAQLEGIVVGGGPGAQRALDELIRVNQQLLALAKQSDNLALQKQSIEELRRIQKYLTDQLVAATGQSDPVLAQIAVALHQEETLKQIAAIEQASIEYIQQVQTAQLENIRLTQEAQLAYVQQVQTAQLAIIAANQESQTQALMASQQAQLAQVTSWQAETVRAIKVDMVAQLQAIQQELRNIFALQYLALTGTQLPGVQRGGIVGLASGLHYAHGGMVPVMLEPGERVYGGPMSRAQEGALMGINRAFPRFAQGGWTVPGSGVGDSVPAWVPSGSFVLNRRAAGTLGYQNGGSVRASSSPAIPSIVIDLKYSTFGSPEDARKVKQIIERDVIKIVEEYQRRLRVDTRLK